MVESVRIKECVVGNERMKVEWSKNVNAKAVQSENLKVRWNENVNTRAVQSMNTKGQAVKLL